MEGHHLHHHQQQQQHHHHHQQMNMSMNMSMMMGGGGVMNVDATDNRFPQWSVDETREFLLIRAELDRSFLETKRNKLLWDFISNKLKEKGYNRSPDQCKCKWKNLVTRFKGCEGIEPEAMRQQQFPFYGEMQAIFGARMQRMLWTEAEGSGGVGSGGPSRRKGVMASSDEEEDANGAEDSDGGGGGGGGGGGTAAKKKKKGKKSGTASAGGGGNSSASELREVLEDFMRQQMQMEMRWQEACDARERERAAKEAEWRSTMQALENERMLMERRWREREEQRRVREEVRAEKRDALITALLNKLRRDDNL